MGSIVNKDSWLRAGAGLLSFCALGASAAGQCETDMLNGPWLNFGADVDVEGSRFMVVSDDFLDLHLQLFAAYRNFVRRRYTPLEAFEGPSTHCPRCDRINLRVDTQTYWTRERRFRNIEELLKIAVGLLVGSLVTIALIQPGIGYGVGHGMAVGTPILIGMLLWDAARITRRRSIFKASIVWPIAGVLFGFLGLHVLPTALSRGSTTTLILVGSALAVAVVGVLAPLSTWGWRRFKERRVESSQQSRCTILG